MPNPREEGKNHVPFTPQEVVLAQSALNLGHYIQKRLGLLDAMIVHPTDMLKAVAAAYVPEDIIRLYLESPAIHAQNAIASFNPKIFEVTGRTREQLVAHYPDLVGRGDYAKGELTQTLKSARQSLAKDEAVRLERTCADLFALGLAIDPELAPEPNITLSPTGRDVQAGGASMFRFSQSPQIVVEYGPGIAGAKKIKSEILPSPHRQTIFIENSVFPSQVIAQTGSLYGISSINGRIITREDGIKAASTELLRVGAQGSVDIIISSMVHSAGEESLRAGIENGYHLLRPGGAFVIQAVNEVRPEEASASFIFQTARKIFSKGPSYNQRFSYIKQTTKELTTGIRTVFVK